MKKSSGVDPTQQPFFHQWDQTFRENWGMYQREINKLTFHLQKSQRGWGLLGQWNYPWQHQRCFLNLRLYQTKQLVGKVMPEEVSIYKEAVNPKITKDLKRTFNTRLDIPKAGLTAGLLA